MEIGEFIGEKVIYDDCGQFIWGVSKEEGLQKIADLRGWGAIQNLFKTPDGNIDTIKAENFQDALGKWIVDAINEKLERERAGV